MVIAVTFQRSKQVLNLDGWNQNNWMKIGWTYRKEKYISLLILLKKDFKMLTSGDEI